MAVRRRGIDRLYEGCEDSRVHGTPKQPAMCHICHGLKEDRDGQRLYGPALL